MPKFNADSLADNSGLDFALRSDEFLALLIAAHGEGGRPDLYEGYDSKRASRPVKIEPPQR